MGMGSAQNRTWFVMWPLDAAGCGGPAPSRAGTTPTRSRCARVFGKIGHVLMWNEGIYGQKLVGLGLRWAKIGWVWAPMGKNWLGFGQPWAKSTRGFGQPWAKISWVWATMGKNWLGLGNYGQKLVGFG